MASTGKNNRRAQKQVLFEKDESVLQLGRFLLQRLQRNLLQSNRQSSGLTEIKLQNRRLLIKSDVGGCASNAGAYAVHALANTLACHGAEPKNFWVTRFLPAGRDPDPEGSRVLEEISQTCKRLNVTWLGEQTSHLNGISQPILANYMLAEAASGRRYIPQNIKPDDRIILTSTLGTAAAALIAHTREKELAEAFDLRFAQRCQRLLSESEVSILPPARIAWKVEGIHAMRDLFETSLASALHQLVDANNLDVEIDSGQIDLLPEVKVVCEHFSLAPLGVCAPGALVIVGEAQACESLLGKFRLAKIPAKIIGQVLKAGEGRWLVAEVERIKLPDYRDEESLRIPGILEATAGTEPPPT